MANHWLKFLLWIILKKLDNMKPIALITEAIFEKQLNVELIHLKVNIINIINYK